jgi:uncharacterized protein (TIGR02266 family)
MTLSRPNKRTSARCSTRVFGIFGHDLDLDKTEMMMLNLSLGGAFIKTETPVPSGQPVMLRIFLDPAGQPLSFAGEVVWSRSTGGDKEAGMGVKFTQMTPGELAQFKEFLAGLIEADLFA